MYLGRWKRVVGWAHTQHALGFCRCMEILQKQVELEVWLVGGKKIKDIPLGSCIGLAELDEWREFLRTLILPHKEDPLCIFWGEHWVFIFFFELPQNCQEVCLFKYRLWVCGTVSQSLLYLYLAYYLWALESWMQ